MKMVTSILPAPYDLFQSIPVCAAALIDIKRQVKSMMIKRMAPPD
jgi:hypothetical protein